LVDGGSGGKDERGKEDEAATDNTIVSEVDFIQWLVKGRPYKSLHSGRVLYDTFNRS
jgi:hypothetical protein